MIANTWRANIFFFTFLADLFNVGHPKFLHVFNFGNNLCT